jgi:hypothetical protein
LRRRLFLTSTLASLAAGLYGANRASASDEAEPLRAAGLVRQGEVWLLPEERKAREQIAALPQLRDSIQLLQRDLDELVKQNRQTYEIIKPIIESLEQAIGRLASNDPKRRTLEKQLAAERRKATPPEKFGGKSEVRSMIARLSQQRINLTLQILSLRRIVPELIQKYADLAKDTSVAHAIEQLGRGNRLGPLRPLEPEMRKLGEFESVVLTPYVPIWLQSGHVRFTAIVDERHPLTMTWNEYPGHGLLLTASAAQALDVRPQPGAETRSLNFPKQRKVNAQRSTIASLRLGRWVAPDVPAWILAPEGEDLGSQLDSTALASYTASCEPAALRLTLSRD